MLRAIPPFALHLLPQNRPTRSQLRTYPQKRWRFSEKRRRFSEKRWTFSKKRRRFSEKRWTFFQSSSEVSLEGTHYPIFFVEMMNPHHPIHPPKSSLKRHSATRHWKDIYGQFSYFGSFFAI